MADEIKAIYQGGLRCQATHRRSGQQIYTEASTDDGGRGEAFSPTHLVETALATCVLTIMGIVAARHDVDLRGTEVDVTKEMIQSPTRRIGRLATRVTFPVALELDDAMRKRLASAARRCPVHQSLHPDIDAPIEFQTG